METLGGSCDIQFCHFTYTPNSEAVPAQISALDFTSAGGIVGVTPQVSFTNKIPQALLSTRGEARGRGHVIELFKVSLEKT